MSETKNLLSVQPKNHPFIFASSFTKYVLITKTARSKEFRESRIGKVGNDN